MYLPNFKYLKQERIVLDILRVIFQNIDNLFEIYKYINEKYDKTNKMYILIIIIIIDVSVDFVTFFSLRIYMQL